MFKNFKVKIREIEMFGRPGADGGYIGRRDTVTHEKEQKQNPNFSYYYFHGVVKDVVPLPCNEYLDITVLLLAICRRLKFIRFSVKMSAFRSDIFHKEDEVWIKILASQLKKGEPTVGIIPISVGELLELSENIEQDAYIPYVLEGRCIIQTINLGPFHGGKF